MKEFIIKILSFVLFFAGFLLLICEPVSDVDWFRTFFISKGFALVSFVMAYICAYFYERGVNK